MNPSLSVRVRTGPKLIRASLAHAHSAIYRLLRRYLLGLTPLLYNLS